MTVYADEAFIINAAADYILLLTSARICDAEVKRLRLGAAAILGGLYGAAGYIAPLRHPLAILAAGVLVSLIAFGGEKKLMRLTLVFFAVSAAFGGGAAALMQLTGGRMELTSLTAVFIVCFIVMTLIFRRAARCEGAVSELSISFRGRGICVKALHDTGNSLSDPISGKRVAVISLDDSLRLFGSEKPIISELRSIGAAEVMRRLADSRFRLVPYSAVGVKSGLMLAFLPDEVTVDGKKQNIIIGLSPSPVTDGGAYSALIGA